MKRYAGWVVFVVAAALVTPFGCQAPQVPLLNLQTVSGSHEVLTGKCDIKERCVIVYLAPWCGVCHASIPLLQTLRARADRSGKVAIIPVVGADSPAKVKAMASKLGGEVYMDPEGELRSAMRSSGVPVWWVIGPDRKVITKVSGGMSAADERAVQWFIGHQLKLETYL